MPLLRVSFYQLNFCQDWWTGNREYWFLRGVSKNPGLPGSGLRREYILKNDHKQNIFFLSLTKPSFLMKNDIFLTFFYQYLLMFSHSDHEAQPRGGPKADISETFRSTVRGSGGRAPTTHPQGRIFSKK